MYNGSSYDYIDIQLLNKARTLIKSQTLFVTKKLLHFTLKSFFQ